MTVISISGNSFSLFKYLAPWILLITWGCHSAAPPPKIVIYTKVGCPRCAKATLMLQQQHLLFEEKSIGQREWAGEMWQALKKNGHVPGKSVTMPVVLVDSTLYYNIEDIPQFFSSLQ
jgi:glutaredoxin